MNLKRRTLKARALLLMQGNWLVSISLTAIWAAVDVFLIQLLPMRRPLLSELVAAKDAVGVIRLLIPREITPRIIALTAVVVLLHLFIIAPFNIGVKKFYLSVALGMKGKLSTVFSVYTDFKGILKDVLLKIIVFVMSAFWFVIFMLLPAGIYGLSVIKDSNDILFASFGLSAVMYVLWILWTDRYKFAFYILACEKDVSAFGAMKKCIGIMRSATWEVIVLRISYYLWELVSSSCTPLAFIYGGLSGTTYAEYALCFTGNLEVGEIDMNKFKDGVDK